MIISLTTADCQINKFRCITLTSILRDRAYNQLDFYDSIKLINEGIKALFNAAKKNREFSTVGGDVLFLMSRLAVTTIGAHKESATSYFKKV